MQRTGRVIPEESVAGRGRVEGEVDMRSPVRPEGPLSKGSEGLLTEGKEGLLTEGKEGLLTEGKEAGAGGASAAYTVLFDGDCPVCRRAVDRLRSWDREKKLRFLPAAAPEVEGRFPWISDEALRKSLHLVGPDQQTWEGAGAVEQLIGLLPGWRWAARFFRLPGARWLARKGYRWIAENRLALGCGEHCGSGDQPLA